MSSSRDVRRNLPDVVAEVRAVFARYEEALVANDVEVLVELFHRGDATVRYGIDDQQRGWDELAAYRRTQARATPPRELRDTVIQTFGEDVATVDTEFVPRGADGTPDPVAVGRQSQTWVRTTGGWRVVSAHVSWRGGRGPDNSIDTDAIVTGP